MFLYRDIFKKSFKISWRYKHLWFFGLFATLIAGSGKYNMPFSRMGEAWNNNVFASLATLTKDGSFFKTLFSNLKMLYAQDMVSASIYTVMGLVFIFLFLFLLWLAVVSQVGLIHNVAEVLKEKSKSSPTLKKGIGAGVKNFWPVLVLNLFLNSLIIFFAALIGLPLLFIGTENVGYVSLLYLILFIIFIPVALILSFLLKYAVCFIVIKGEKFTNSIVHAWKLFVKNWLISIEMALILFLFDVMFIVALAFIILILAIPYLFIAFGFSYLVSQNLFLMLFVFGIFLSILIVIWAGSVITTFKLASWTNLFMYITTKKGIAKILRLAGRSK